MTMHRLSAATAAVAVVLSAAKTLTGALSVLTLSSLTCVRPLSVLAPAGLHLDLLASSSLCPEHTYLAGPHLDSAASLLAVVAALVLAAGLVGALLALGAGWWARRALHAANAWFTTCLDLTRGGPAPAIAPLLLGSAPDPAPGALGLPRPYRRRGPPVGQR
ncbi:MAG: hypothetical protein Q4G43_02800 [Mobilicoccus sp.]|nr:hypothetical protein [Mobilicoccus sp.]